MEILTNPQSAGTLAHRDWCTCIFSHPDHNHNPSRMKRCHGTLFAAALHVKRPGMEILILLNFPAEFSICKSSTIGHDRDERDISFVQARYATAFACCIRLSLITSVDHRSLDSR